MEKFKIHTHVWMTSGHEFDDVFYFLQKPDCKDIEDLMHIKAKQRGFEGLNDIESFEVNVTKY